MRQQRVARVAVAVGLAVIASAAAPVAIPRADAAIRPRNGRIVFTVSQLPDALDGYVDSDLFTVSPSGHDLQQLTQTPGTGEFEPNWSPDGRRIVLSRLDPVGNPGGALDVYVMDFADPASPLNTTNTPLQNDESPAWSPDGMKIVFSRDSLPSAYRSQERFVQGDIYIMDSGGGSVQQIVDDAGDDHDPEWSPRGDAIVYTHDFSQIRLIRPDGSGRVNLARGIAPSWSPDGRTIAFQNSGDIFVIGHKGAARRNVTSTHGDGEDQDPTWSPDGKWIAFVSDRETEGEYKLYKMRPDGSDVAQIVDITLGTERSGIDWGPRP